MGAKAVTLPISAVTVLVTTRTLVSSLGVPGYAMVALVTTLTALLPLGDLGVGAAIMDAMARSRDGDQESLRRAVTSGARTLMTAGALIAAVGLLPACWGVWTPLLGHAGQPGTDSCVAVAFTLFGCSLPLGLGRSVLIALNRNHVALLLQGAGSVFSLLLLLAAAGVHAPAAAFVASGFLAQCAVGVICLLMAGRILSMPLLGLVVGSVQRGRPRARIGHLAVPMVVINAGSALAYATDRLVLSHVADATGVAVYSAGAQLFAPAIGLISVAGMPLWTLFARQRESQDIPSQRDLVGLTLQFAAGGLVAGAGLVVIGPVVGAWMVHDRIPVSTGLMAAFAALLFVQAVNYPSSMWLTDAAGLRFQAIRVSIMAVANLALSIPLARLFGAPGPVVGSVIAFSAFVVVPSMRKTLPLNATTQQREAGAAAPSLSG